MGVIGQAELRELALLLRDVANRDMEQRLRHEMADVYDGLEPAIRANAATMLPSGYGPTMARSARVGVTLGLRGALTVRATVYARGKSSDRDVRAINRGVLRHPLFGNRLRWYATRVPPGFVDRAADDIPDEAHRRAQRAVDKVLIELRRG